MPDIDHRESTITKTFGPLTKLLSFVIRKCTGGHRMGTHSFLGIAALGALAQYGVVYRYTTVGAIVLCSLMALGFSGAIRLLGIPGWFDDLIPIPIVIGIVRFTDVSLEIIPPALMLGCFIHVMGDVVTKSGCPLWWPFSMRRVKLALFKTNGKVERWIVVPVVIVGIIAGIFGKVLDTML